MNRQYNEEHLLLDDSVRELAPRGMDGRYCLCQKKLRKGGMKEAVEDQIKEAMKEGKNQKGIKQARNKGGRVESRIAFQLQRLPNPACKNVQEAMSTNSSRYQINHSLS